MRRLPAGRGRALLPALALALACLAGGLRAATLEETLTRVHGESPRLAAERARLRAVDEQVPQALAGWRPRAQLRSGWTLDRETRDSHRVPARPVGDREGNRDTEVFRQFDNRLTVRQPLYSGGETVAETRRAENNVQAARARLGGVGQDVLLNAVDAYAGVVRARNVVRLARENLDRLNQYLGGTEERLRLFEVTRTDLDQAQSRVAGAEAELARAETELAAALAFFEQVVGEPPGELVPARPLADLPASEAEALALAARNPRLVQAAFELEAARDQVRVAEAALLPDLALVGELTHETQPTFGIDNRSDASLGVELVVPLYQGGAEYSRVRQAKQTMIQARYLLDDTERLVRREVLRSFDAWRSIERQITALRAQTDAAARALEGTREEAIAGVRTTLDVLNAELELFQAQSRLERAREAEIAASYDLKAAIGGLDPDGLDLAGPPYDPEAHYRAVRNRWFGLAVDYPEGMGPLPER